MPTQNRAILFLLSAIAASCHRGGSSSVGGGPIRTIDVDAPFGLEGPAVSKCDRDGKKCAPVAKDDALGDGTLVKSARGARASFELGPATSLELGEDSAVVIDSTSGIDVQQGSVVVRKLGSASEKSDPFRIEVAGRTGEVDPKIGGSVVVRAKSADRATVTVEKGKLTLRSSGGQTTVVLSGETVDLVKGKPPERVASFVAVEARPHSVAQPTLVADAGPRGLGRMTARVPGRTDVVSGVRLMAHNVDVVLRDGLARTEIEEVFQNDSAQVLEGRYVFPLPADASISSLALWVNDKPVQAEIVEKKRGATIFKSIVEDTVRPRDPALLEWVAGGDFSLKIFPLPPKGNRKVRIAYDQVLKESGGRVRYVYPLSVGAERATQIDDFTVQVRATDTRSRLDEVETPRYATSKNGDERGFQVSFGAKQFTPANDFVVSYARQTDADAEVSAYVPSWGEFKGGGLDDAARGAEGAGYFALRLSADLPVGMTPAHVRRDRAIVIDTSHSQSKETLEGEAKLASGLVRQLDADERFVVLACDSACVTFPDAGLSSVGDEKVAELDKWLGERAPTGSSDVAGALFDAARRLEPNGSGQVVYIGDGSPTSGELSAATVAARTRPVLDERKADLRFLGAGRAVDEVVLSALAQTLGATYEPVTTGESMESRIADLGMSLRSPVIPRRADGATEQLHRRLPAHVALGDERRACAHWRSLHHLQPQSDEFPFESLRCRARVLDDRDAVLSEMRAASKPGKLVSELVGQVEGGRPPPFSKSVAGAGQFEAEVTCSFGERCPTVFVVSPLGTVFSPFTPTDSRSSGKSVAFAGLRDGTYMTLLVGGSSDARGEVQLRALGSTKKFPIAHGGRQTLAATRVTIPDLTRWSIMGSEGFLFAR